ncbi:unnamed protein product [Gongylonema pulchrum]|uniref:Ovule protein n=1 Tax=Gongylonema pulchrum TaxID=637853 RepID=A0A183ERL0_9BILA|nr:unnamed protein product [Gongylonema pulchrum]
MCRNFHFTDSVFNTQTLNTNSAMRRSKPGANVSLSKNVKSLNYFTSYLSYSSLATKHLKQALRMQHSREA